MDALGIVDIYGHIPDKSELILGVGNYNNIHGLLTYFPSEHLLQIQQLREVLTPSVIELILTYEKPSHADNTNRIYFSLGVKDVVPPKSELVCSENIVSESIQKESILSQQKCNKYINVKVELDGDKPVACSCISSEKGFFWVDYSSIDKIPRSQLLAGGLYSFKTTFGEQDYTVSWKIKGFSNGDLIILLPTTWYEKSQDNENFCEMKMGVNLLEEKLKQLSFKGYTNQYWCEEIPFVTHCSIDEYCGNCLGQCGNPNNICYINTDTSLNNPLSHSKFICGSPTLEPDLDQYSMISFSETPPQTTGNVATWVAIIAIVILVALLTWGLTSKVER